MGWVFAARKKLWSGCCYQTNVVAAGNAISFVQQTSVLGTAVTTVNKAFTSDNTAGNLIVVGGTFPTAATQPGVTDSKGNTYTVIQYLSAVGTNILMAYAKNIAAGPNTVTAIWAGNSNARVGLMEYSGASLTAPLETSSTASGATLAGPPDNAIGSITTASAAELILVWFMTQQTGTAGTGYTLRAAPNTFNFFEDRTAGAAGVYPVAASEAITATFAIIAAAFKS